MLAWLTQYVLLAQASGTAEEAAVAAEPPIPVVVITGIVLVFAILVLLFVILQIEGRIFSSIDRKKGNKQPADETALAIVPAPAASAPKVQSGISPEVVAAIAAAVAASSGGAYTLRSVKTVKKGRGNWGFAGVIQSTEPF